MKPSASSPQAAVCCARCGSPFDCGGQAEPFDCWCRAMPVLPAGRFDSTTGCLCPECLATAMAQAAQASRSKPDA